MSKYKRKKNKSQAEVFPNLDLFLLTKYKRIQSIAKNRQDIICKRLMRSFTQLEAHYNQKNVTSQDTKKIKKMIICILSPFMLK